MYYIIVQFANFINNKICPKQDCILVNIYRWSLYVHILYIYKGKLTVCTHYLNSKND